MGNSIKELEDLLKKAEANLSLSLKDEEKAKEKAEKSPEKAKLQRDYENAKEQVAIDRELVEKATQDLKSAKAQKVTLEEGTVLTNKLRSRLNLYGDIILAGGNSFTLTKDMLSNDALMRIIRHSLDIGLLA